MALCLTDTLARVRASARHHAAGRGIFLFGGFAMLMVMSDERTTHFGFQEIPEDENALSRDDMDELNHQIDSDFELGQIFQSQFVPKAFLYFMGEVDDSDEEDSDYEPEEGDDDDEDEDEDDEEESDEEESDEEQAPKGKGGKKGGKKGGNPAGGPENPEECKQQ